ncbi:type II secretion system F family protein [Methanotorris formicicus]|uniref:Type II secretion system F domain protein n=1 Tax=Methanotorris formicicus Mc-S-70 TaxID=647171 RepID=H1KYE1_9EURY|nr:type II secretion system F family protein [Methanotorris formicicus]EHP87225.1 Type II secretion system F domain protein [Methanotorris formicicus Mc-S-70]
MKKKPYREFFKDISKHIDDILIKIGLKKRRIKISDISKREYTWKGKRESIVESEEELTFYEPFVEETPIEIEDLDDILFEEGLGIFEEYSKSLSYWVTRTSFLPSKKDFQYAGIEDEKKYFAKVLLTSFGTFIILSLYHTILNKNPISGLINGFIFAFGILITSILYPKLKLMLFKGEIKFQILFALLYMVSVVKVGISLQEAIENVAKSPEYGVVSYEFKTLIHDINVGGYSFVEALERAKLRTKIPLMKVLYDQLIVAFNKGNVALLLEKMYEEIVRESMVKIDSSKFMIQNLGNLVFGVGLILPFSGMIQSALGGQQGFSGIVDTLDIVLTKIGPISTIIFTIFIKMKIE